PAPAKSTLTLACAAAAAPFNDSNNPSSSTRAASSTSGDGPANTANQDRTAASDNPSPALPRGESVVVAVPTGAGVPAMHPRYPPLGQVFETSPGMWTPTTARHRCGQGAELSAAVTDGEVVHPPTVAHRSVIPRPVSIKTSSTVTPWLASSTSSAPCCAPDRPSPARGSSTRP